MDIGPSPAIVANPGKIVRDPLRIYPPPAGLGTPDRESLSRGL
jgi:hypothetical protein